MGIRWWFHKRGADTAGGAVVGSARVRLCQARFLGCTVRAERVVRPKHRRHGIEEGRPRAARTVGLCRACQRVLRLEPGLWSEVIGSDANGNVAEGVENGTQRTASEGNGEQSQA
jgi:hypothetical protein